TTQGLNYVGFQGDFLFDSAVCTFLTSSPGPTQAAGLTAVNWNVSGNVLNTGPGTMKTLRISAFSNDFTPLNGMGTLFNVRMLRVSNTPGATSPLVWKPDPDNFIFIDDNLDQHTPNQTNGLITITGVPPTPSPTPTATATATASPIPTPTSTPSPTATPCGMPGAWTIVANYPVSIESSAVGTDGTFAYSAGGYAGGASNALYRYDPIAN